MRYGITHKATAFTLFFLLVAYALIRTAWLSDDAYISFRAVDNFISGYGPVWNVGERVWVYTHPLWFYVVALVEFFIDDIYYVGIFLGIVFTLLTWLYTVKSYRSYFSLAIITITLVASKSVLDYSTSGLENALSYFLLTLFVIAAVNKNKSSYFLFLLGGLIVLNRQDHLLIVLPVLLIAFIKLISTDEKCKTIWKVTLALTPIILWEFFAILYYGSPFPNTAIAKLNTSVDYSESLTQGTYYLFDFLSADPVGFSIIISMLILPLLYNKRYKENINLLLVSLGVLIYLAYIIYIGGDFMGGRFFSSLVVVSSLILIHVLSETDASRRWTLVSLLVVMSLPGSTKTYLSGSDYQSYSIDAKGIADERGFYFQHTGLIRSEGSFIGVNHVWRTQGEHARDEAFKLVLRCYVGFYGYFAGSKVHIIDGYALTDTFLAFQPVRPPWRIGHYERYVPSGYIYYVSNGDRSQLNNKELMLVDDLNNINTKSLFSSERLKSIVRLNTYDYDFSYQDSRSYLYLDSEEYKKVPPKHRCLGVPGSPNIRIN